MTMILPVGSGVEREYVEEFERADIRKAHLHWEESSLKKFEGNKGVTRPLDKLFSRKELGKYSIGFQLYFKFLESLIVFFFITLSPAAYLIYSNYYGGGYTQIQSPFDSLTLGNQPNYENLTTPSLFISSAYSAEMSAMTAELNTHMYIDLGIAVFFFLFYCFYRWSSNSEKEEIDSYNCNVSDYAIQVEGIPSKGVTELDVALHFGRLFGSVNQCKFARDYKGTMLYFADIADLQNEKRRLEAKIKIGASKNTKKVTHLEKHIKRLRTYTSRKLATQFGEKIKSQNDFPAVKGFVLFDTIQAQSRALRVYGKHQSTSFYEMIFCGCCKREMMPQALKLMGKYRIKVFQADEPNNIKWENQDTHPFESFMRFLVVAVVVIICLVVTFAFIIASNVLSYSAQVGASCLESGSTGASLSIFAASQANCECISLSLSQIFSSTKLLNTCSSYLKARSLQITMSVLSGVCIAIINFIIKQIYILLAKFQRYETLSKESRTTIVKYFLSLFINTALIPILANSNIYGFELSERLVQLFINDTNGLIRSTFPNDFNQSWYSQVGGKIMTTMIIAVLSPHLINVMIIPCMRCLRKRKSKKIVFQKDLNHVFTPPEFKISFNCGIALNILFVSLTFSAGMPLLYITGFASFFMINICEKYIVARNCKKPPSYDDKLNQIMISYMPFALFLHCVVAIWMFGCPEIFPYDPTKTYWSQRFTNDNYVDFSNRVQRSFGHAILAAVIFLFITIDIFIWPIFFAYSDKIDKNTQFKMETKRFGTFRQEYKRLTKLGIASYNLKANPNYHDIIEAMQLDVDDDKDLDNSQEADVQKNVLSKANNSSADRLISANNSPNLTPSPGFRMTQARMNQVLPAK